MDSLRLSKHLLSRNNLLIGLGIILFGIAGFMNLQIQKPIIQLTKQETAININKNLLVFMSAGNKRLLTDLLWIQTLLESDLDHYKKRDLNNWLFLRFNTIATLDNKFYENYLYGGQFLAIVKDDLEGADVIYSKGLAVFPDDYLLNYNAGFLNYYEIGNYPKGIELLKKIQDNQRAPVFIKSIIYKLEASMGADLKDIFALVLHNFQTTKDEALKTKLKSDMYAIKAEIDLKCLNNGENGCEILDLEGNRYIKRENTYQAMKEFVPYRIIRRGDSRSPQP